ncbi:protein serine/threonine phosphatase 2C family protein, partial [Candidatus Saccharibacteria bacterium]|nr:protein serine/threonine phosphatase 2C family protein [Candidatus Saccharibacteria bacterium]
NLSVIGDHDAPVSERDRRSVISDMARGKITRTAERELLQGIRRPIDITGVSEVISRLDSKHEMRILTSMTPTGFDNWQDASERDLQSFLRRYPTPMDFESTAEDFLNDIERSNSVEKRREYEKAMSDFKHKIYGKQQDYWLRMKDIEKEAYDYNEDSLQYTEAPQRDQYRSFEAERSSEWQPGEAGYWQTSRAQARNGEISKENIEHGLWADSSCEDSMFIRPDQQMFGVFDGAGGMQGGRNASMLTASVVREFSDHYALMSGSSLAYVLNAANDRVEKSPNAGYSTAVLAKVIKQNGSLKLAYASVGDSRIYIVDKDGNARQITRDEGEGRYITNAIGVEAEPGQSRVQQFGDIDLHKGDRVVLCSDGITGDYGDDLMSERELGFIVSHSRDSLDASKNLITNARKHDDRTAVVFGEFIS